MREQAARGCEDEEMGVRSAALSALLTMDSERAVPILREVLQERDACSAELRRQAKDAAKRGSSANFDWSRVNWA